MTAGLRDDSSGGPAFHTAPRRQMMLGYVRAELVGGRLDDIKDALDEFASLEGFELVEIFIEYGPTTGALWQLTRALLSTRAHDVIIPTLTHLNGGRNPQRHKLSGIIHREYRVWCLDQNDDEALYRATRRYRDIPASPHAAPSSGPRTLLGTFELAAVTGNVAFAKLKIHELLTRAHLRHMVEATERVVQAVLNEAIAVSATTDPAIFADLANSFPVLAPPNNIMTVWLARSGDALEVHIHETASRATQPVSAEVVAAAHGRQVSVSGGTLTWARFPAASTAHLPAVLHSSIAASNQRVPVQTSLLSRATSVSTDPDRGRHVGTSGWGASTSYELPAADTLSPGGQDAGTHDSAKPNDWNWR